MPRGQRHFDVKGRGKLNQTGNALYFATFLLIISPVSILFAGAGFFSSFFSKFKRQKVARITGCGSGFLLRSWSFLLDRGLHSPKTVWQMSVQDKSVGLYSSAHNGVDGLQVRKNRSSRSRSKLA